MCSLRATDVCELQTQCAIFELLKPGWSHLRTVSAAGLRDSHHLLKLHLAAGVCDDDVTQICQKASINPNKNRGIWSIGAVGRCLSRQLAENKRLTPGCHTLVAVAAPKVTLAL